MGDRDTPTWLVDAFREVQANPRISIDRDLRPWAGSTPIAQAAIGFIAVHWIGLSNRDDAESLVSATENGYAFLNIHLPQVVQQFPDLRERAVETYFKSAPPINYDFSAIVRSFIEVGDHEEAAATFLKLAESSKETGPFFEIHRRRAEQVVSELERTIEQNRSADAKIQTQVSQLIEKLGNANENVETLSVKVAETAASRFAADYESQAAMDAHRAKTALASTYIFFAFAIAASLWFVIHAFSGDGDLNAPSTISHVTLSLAFFGLAGFTARLAREYREAMWHWQHTALQLRMFFPFVDRVTEGDRDAVIAAMIPRFFPGQPDHPIKESYTDRLSDSDSRLSDALLEKLINQKQL